MLRKVLFILSLLLIIASVGYMSANRREADRQARAIEAADQRGEDVTVSLATLKAYAGTHMFAGTAVALAGSYARAQATAAVSASAANSSAQVYAAAQAACSGKSDSIVQARCNAQYLASHLANLPSATPVPVPQPADYQFKFTSPFWAPDLAGVLFLGGALVGIWWLLLAFGRKRGRA